MTLDKNQIVAEARRLQEAEISRQQVAATTTIYPNMDIEDAYAIQNAWMVLKKAMGRTVVGYKIGLTSRTMQKSMQINEPDYGTLLDDMVFEDGAEIKVGNFLDPRIEVELAFVLKKRLEGDKVSIFDVLNATDYVVPAIELIAARSYRVHPTTSYVRTVRDTISDNAANGGIILGGRPVKVDAIDLRWVSALLYVNGVIEESGVAAAVLNHPAKGVAWLAKKYAPHGIALEPGQIILAGSFTRPVKIKAGDTYHADYGPLGSISGKFV
jgi:2-oxo-hept-3-ene-1,7-dioate hydratase